MSSGRPASYGKPGWIHDAAAHEGGPLAPGGSVAALVQHDRFGFETPHYLPEPRQVPQHTGLRVLYDPRYRLLCGNAKQLNEGGGDSIRVVDLCLIGCSEPGKTLQVLPAALRWLAGARVSPARWCGYQSHAAAAPEQPRDPSKDASPQHIAAWSLQGVKAVT